MATLRELKGRIGSVASTEKITGAMKMISSAKMRKAELASDAEFTSPLTEVRDVQRYAVVAFGSDDGLCGAYNANLCKFVQACVDDLRASFGEGLQVEVYPVGAKMLKAVSRVGAHINVDILDPAGATSKTEGDEVKTLLETLMQRYLAGEIDRVDLAYMHYHSAGRQRPVAEQLLPVGPAAPAGDGAVASNRPYIYEPDALSIFRTLLPMHLLASLQDAFAENRASEQAARVMAMQARKLLEQLQLEYNKLRQQSITTELLDIVGGQTRD